MTSVSHGAAVIMAVAGVGMCAPVVKSEENGSKHALPFAMLRGATVTGLAAHPAPGDLFESTVGVPGSEILGRCTQWVRSPPGCDLEQTIQPGTSHADWSTALTSRGSVVFDHRTTTNMPLPCSAALLGAWTMAETLVTASFTVKWERSVFPMRRIADGPV